jgi:hypothetical protein
MPVTVLPFPDLPFEAFDLEPVSTQEVSPMEGRATETADFDTPYWRLTSARTPKLNNGELDIVDAFFMRAALGSTVFECHDVYRPRPRAYGASPLSGTRAGGGAFDGTATLSAVTDSRTIVVSSLPAEFAFELGAMVEIRRSSTVRSLHRIMEAATANESGVVTLSILFPLDTQVFTTANSIVNFERPSCLMKLDPGASAPKARADRRARFSAREIFPNG